MKKIIGVVVPDLSDSGGVQTIAEMVIKQIESHPDYECRIFSLATSSSDECSVKLTKPKSWIQGLKTKKMMWRNREITHVGCYFTELEFMRYQPRKILNDLLNQCDLVQVVSGFPAWGNVVIKHDKPVAVWSATLCAWERRTIFFNSSGMKNSFRKLMTYLTSKIDNRVIARTKKMMVMNSLVENYAKEINPFKNAVVYAPAGVNINWFIPDTNKKKDSSYVLAVGRLADKRKNMPLLLESFKLLKIKHPGPLKLILAGGSSPTEEFWNKVETYKLNEEVVFVSNPNANELKLLYQNAKCLALSSDEEGFGMVLIEAMACGIPVVATRCGGPDNIITDGVDGFLTEIGNAEELCAKLEQLCFNDELNLKMSVAARSTVEKRFSEEAVAKVFYDTWAELIN